MKQFNLKVPSSSANIGPGFDGLGIALQKYLNIDVSYEKEIGQDEVVLNYSGDGQEALNKVAAKDNLIIQSMYYVLNKYQLDKVGGKLKLNINNDIPLSRGLGSSASAVVAGVLIANKISDLDLNQDKILSLILELENHPDNVVPCLLGGLIGSYVDNDITSNEVSKVSYVKFDINQNIRAIVVIPDYSLATKEAREALPNNYSRADVVFNLQRLMVLTQALCQPNLEPELIYGSMKDKIHQPYRQHLIPGLKQVLETLTPKEYPGLLGVCLSGAGPTVLALATDNFETIGTSIKSVLDKFGKCKCNYSILEIDFTGAKLTEQ